MKEKKYIIVKDNNLESALIKGANYLKININDCEYSIIESNKNEIKVKIWHKSFSLQNNKENKELNLEEKLENLDGYFKIEYIDGFACLTVFPPNGNGKEVYIEDVINRMKILNIPWVDNNIIKNIIKEAKGRPEKLVLWKEGADYRATIDIIISEDKMSAKIIMFPPKKGGSNLTTEEIIKILNEKGIVFGINRTLIEEIVKNKIFKQEIEIAKGLAPKIGVPSNIKYYFDTNPGKPFLTDEYDRINFKELNFVQNKKKNDILAEIIEPIKGEHGFNIFGERLNPPEIEENNILLGENVAFSEDKKKIIATIDGNAKIKNGKIMIEPLLEIENVDYSTGNIDFDGDIIIKGTILDGFTVKGKGIIQIGLAVGKVFLKSNGDIILKSGMNGGNEGFIETNSNIYARYIESVNIKSCESLFIEEAMMNCVANVNKNLIFTGKRGELLGGITIVGGNVRCKKIGNPFGIKTILKIGVEPQIVKFISDFEKNIKEKKELLKTVEDRLLTYSKILQQNPRDNIIIEKHKKLNEVLQRLKDEITSAEREYKEAIEMLIPKEKKYVIVEHTLYNSSKIYFGKEEYSSTKDINKIILKYVNNRIIESGFTNEKEIPKFE